MNIVEASTQRPLTPTGTAVRLAIAGNPNSGKTSIFNALTGTLQSVGNWPGVTVSRKEGTAHLGSRRFTVVDLPGTYSLTAYSLEEVVARDYIIDDQPEVVVNVLDASNLERNLYLTAQLIEMQTPLVVALNMVDIAERRQLRIDIKRLSGLLGVPVVTTQGHRAIGMEALLRTCGEVADHRQATNPHQVHYGHEVEAELQGLTARIAADPAITARYVPRWVAVKLLEKDPEVLKAIHALSTDAAGIEAAAQQAIHAIERHGGESADTLIAERRYGFAAGVVRDCVAPTGLAVQNLTDRIDAVVCHRLLGPMILAGVIYSLFLSVFKVADEWRWLFGRSPTGWFEAFFETCQRWIDPLHAKAPLLCSLLRDGIIGGVGGVVSYAPLIAVMFMFIAILEDTGYIARVAFILDRPLRAFGLQGKSILALIVSGGLGGGGCCVPGILATRTLREERDRLVTMLVVPLMNCGAKMPVYLMLIAAFFAHRKAQMMFLMWLLSWVMSLIAAWTLRRFVIRGEQTPFVMELPAYHLPTVRGVLLHTWERTWVYLKKAGTLILGVSVILWAAMSFPQIDEPTERAAIQKSDPAASEPQITNRLAQARLAHSLAGRLGTAIASVTQLAGFDWRTNIALIGGLAAKEVVVGTLGTAYAIGEIDPAVSVTLSDHLRDDPSWNPIRAMALMIFVMIYAPCLPTLAVIHREGGRRRWTALAMAYTITLAFTMAVVVYQIGSLLYGR